MSSNTWGYIINRGDSGEIVKWSTNLNMVNLYVDLSNINGSATQTRYWSIILNSVYEWNQASNLKINPIQQSNTGKALGNGLNELYFTEDPMADGLGSGVLGISRLQYEQGSGEILEGDIVINRNEYFGVTEYINDTKYIGNAITHELGHLLGLAHNEVYNSTMYYLGTKGQYWAHSDDKAGVYSLYNPSGSKGNIRGKIVGGRDAIPVFGAHVQAVSVLSGKVIAAAISQIDGSFAIRGLDLGDAYSLYIRPIVNTSPLPSYYSEVRKNYCPGGQSYRGSFFQSCFTYEQGFPQRIMITSNSPSVNVGSVTIHCGLETPLSYFDNKHQKDVVDNRPDNDIELDNNYNSSQSFVGMFTKQYFDHSQIDTYRLNISLSVPADSILQIKLVSQSLHSPLKLKLSAVNGILDSWANNNCVGGTCQPITDIDGNIDWDIRGKIALNNFIGQDLILKVESLGESWTATAYQQYNYSDESEYNRYKDDI
ncbi:MAG: matrixin family metalloprotease, partial [Pseudomonadota bacterium]